LRWLAEARQFFSPGLSSAVRRAAMGKIRGKLEKMQTEETTQKPQDGKS